MCLKTGINAVSFLPILSCVFGVFNQWQLQHTGSPGSARVFDYDLYRGKRAWLLCIFVPQPTVPLHQVVNSAYFHWALPLFIYFRSMSGLSRSCCRWPE